MKIIKSQINKLNLSYMMSFDNNRSNIAGDYTCRDLVPAQGTAVSQHDGGDHRKDSDV